MLLLNASEDTDDVMNRFKGVVLSTCELDYAFRKKYFVRPAEMWDIITDMILCHFLGGRIEFKWVAVERYDPSRYERGYYEGQYKEVRIRVGFVELTRGSSCHLSIRKDDSEIYSGFHPKEVVLRLFWAIKEKFEGTQPQPTSQRWLDQEKEEEEKFKELMILLGP